MPLFKFTRHGGQARGSQPHSPLPWIALIALILGAVALGFAWLAGWGDVAFTGGKDIPYFLVPLCAPVVGAALGAFSYRKLIGRHLPCDTCVDEEQESPSSSSTQHKASL